PSEPDVDRLAGVVDEVVPADQDIVRTRAEERRKYHDWGAVEHELAVQCSPAGEPTRKADRAEDAGEDEQGVPAHIQGSQRKCDWIVESWHSGTLTDSSALPDELCHSEPRAVPAWR